MTLREEFEKALIDLLNSFGQFQIYKNTYASQEEMYNIFIKFKKIFIEKWAPKDNEVCFKFTSMGNSPEKDSTQSIDENMQLKPHTSLLQPKHDASLLQISRRDYFSGIALQGLLIGSIQSPDKLNAYNFAFSAIVFADSLIKELDGDKAGE